MRASWTSKLKEPQLEQMLQPQQPSQAPVSARGLVGDDGAPQLVGRPKMKKSETVTFQHESVELGHAVKYNTRRSTGRPSTNLVTFAPFKSFDNKSTAYQTGRANVALQILAAGSGRRSLDFFSRTESSVQEARTLIRQNAGIGSTRHLRSTIMGHIDLIHDHPLQTLNDRLKKYPFVDGAPFDHLLREMIRTVVEWLAWITKPDWLVEVAHQAGTAQDETSSGAPASQHDVGDRWLKNRHFHYPFALKLRDLQGMIRPFMEARSSHHISGLDAVISELVRTLLALFQCLEAWDRAIGAQIDKLGLKSSALSADPRAVQALGELCAILGMDNFEVAHQLNRIDSQKFFLVHTDIEQLVQKYPLILDQRLLAGPPVPPVAGDGVTRFAKGMEDDGEPDIAEADATHPVAERTQSKGVSDMRGTMRALSKNQTPPLLTEELNWWRSHKFGPVGRAAPTRAVATAMLSDLVDGGFHPDPHVAQRFPAVLEMLFGVQISRWAFLHRLVPRLAGFVDHSGRSVPVMDGRAGFPLISDRGRCAEVLLLFLRQWERHVGNVCDPAMLSARNKRLCEADTIQLARPGVGSGAVGAQELTDRGLERVCWQTAALESKDEGHSTRDLVRLLEGEVSIPDYVLKIPNSPKRFCIGEHEQRQWEVAMGQFNDLVELLDEHDRDLGPYIELDLDDHDALAEAWQATGPPAPRAEEALPMEADRYVDHSVKVSDRFSLSLSGWPEETEGGKMSAVCACGNVFIADAVFCRRCGAQRPKRTNTGEGSSSTFVRFFSEDGNEVSRKCLQGLPALPWSFGTDSRNTIIVDLPGAGLAPFHCMFTESASQPWRASVIPLGSTAAQSYIVCPKYQRIAVRNGYRFKCGSWTFELRVTPIDNHKCALQILSDEGVVYDVPEEGCHVGAGNRSRHLDYQPNFPLPKFSLKHRLGQLSAVHLAFIYSPATNRWMLVDHSHDPLGCLLILKEGMAYPLSEGMRIKMGSVILEASFGEDAAFQHSRQHTSLVAPGGAGPFGPSATSIAESLRSPRSKANARFYSDSDTRGERSANYYESNDSDAPAWDPRSARQSEKWPDDP